MWSIAEQCKFLQSRTHNGVLYLQCVQVKLIERHTNTSYTTVHSGWGEAEEYVAAATDALDLHSWSISLLGRT
jgi:hypothetical protein